MRALAIIGLAVAACGSGQPSSSASTAAANTNSYDIQPRFDAGKSYRVRTETSSEIETPTAGTTKADVVMESVREIATGGTFRQDALKWQETVERITIGGQKSWDSNGSEPPADDLVEVAALAGSKYVVAIDARGIASVSELDVPMPKLSDEQRNRVKAGMGDVERVATGLAASVASSLSSTPNGQHKIGDTWSHERRNPALGPDALVEMRWTLAKVEGSEARFEVTGLYKAKAVAKGTVKGFATYDLDHRYFTMMEEASTIVLKRGAGKLVTINRVQISQSE